MDGQIVSTQKDIKKEAERFFSEFLNRQPTNYQGVSEEELEELLGFRCTPEDCRMLEAEVSEEEICKVLFAMPSNKSPNLMGFLVSSLNQPGQS